ncbi:MAG: aminotransferase class V-fold PLP-dependent enzyme [Candidatus Marinimicrobia bacterium]|jgi:selenocysteine lyase/cysteine desulfurase|nr:aminotransferase class V-fold PLP-dependent enzyme [Candidatus Neomarinimicrobiota bacterium]MDP6611164.1 aminotransferase class V-fold PLP-dependent enzyme [Candidatus Neomarinimicrobiota bacterium]|tara:strand:- start:122 stop:1609 length:1488 start_codon:yes stop_codon:yes gene_type:complete
MTKIVQSENLLLSKIQNDFIGLDTLYTLADGRKTARVYLDSTASTLMMGAAHDMLEEFFNHYANSHSLLHFSAKITTIQYDWAHWRILSFLGADPKKYTCFFTGSGTTAGINRLARVFRDYRKDKDVVLVSIMEHHSNDLPHRKHAGEVVHIPLKSHSSGQPGCLDKKSLEENLKKYRDRVNYVAITGISNVTGIINPIYDIAELAHDYGALVLIDGAQMAAHMPVQMSGHSNASRNIDAFVFSGHKTYVPGSPGAVLCRKEILMAIEPEELGGGMVEDVFVDKYIIKDYFPDREEAGTPNIPGAIALAAAIEVMDRVGMETIYQEEEKLVRDTMERMKKIPGIIIYGETDSDKCSRAGSISFNIKGMHHGLAAAVLNDYFNIAVRNECFCAHPYVKELILDDMLDAITDIPDEEIESKYKLLAGMVRASFGIYNKPEDVDALIDALQEIVSRKEELIELYHVDESGNYVHNSFKIATENNFSIADLLDEYLNVK